MSRINRRDSIMKLVAGLAINSIGISDRTSLASQADKPNQNDLEAIINSIDPKVSKWASVCVVKGTENEPSFQWFHYKNSSSLVNFWPASTIKLYTVVAALELLNEIKMPFNSVIIFERKQNDKWHLDTSRTMPEMISEIFRRSSNEDYTLLLRMVGIDRINTNLLTKNRGFPRSALMRGYVRHRPYLYVPNEPQRITVQDLAGQRKIINHVWSGKSYSKERGASIISQTNGNCTSTWELAECLRRIMFHEHLPRSERYYLTEGQLAFLREGVEGLTGLRNTKGYVADSAREIFPKAKFYFKEGLISNYTLDLAFVDDSADSGRRYIVSIAANSGKDKTIKAMSRAIAAWVKKYH